MNRSKQIALDQTSLDAAKSSIVYSVTKGVSTAGRAVRLYFPVLQTDLHTFEGYDFILKSSAERCWEEPSDRSPSKISSSIERGYSAMFPDTFHAFV